MKKIFFILPTVGFGGAEKVYIDIAAYFSLKEDYEVKLIYLTEINNQRELPPHLKYTCLKVPNVKSSIKKLNRLFREEKPDIVFSSLTHLNILLSFVKILFGHKFKLYLRQTNIISLQKKNKYIHWLSKKIISFFYNQSDGVIFQSEFMREDFNSLIKIKKSIVINNPIDSKNLFHKSLENPIVYTKQSDVLNLVIIGRLVSVKNVQYLIRKMREAKKVSDYHLYIIGDGGERESLETLANKLSLESNITFLGQISNPYKYLKNMDLLINTSFSEGFPNVLLEALALNIPVLAKKQTGGTEELMRKIGIENYYLEELNFDEFKNIIANYPSSLSLKVEKNYGVEKIARKYIEFIS